jgi:hypothetical protein
MHASAVVIGGRVWALLADRDGGKSTTAALLADRGCALFTDDLLILDGLECFAGPASVDLRAEAAGRLGGASLGVVGNRERWRKAFPVGVLQAPLGGWIELAWSDELVSVDPIEAVADRLALLDRHKSLPMNGEQILDLATVPMFRWSRPRSLGAAGEAVDALIAATV